MSINIKGAWAALVAGDTDAALECLFGDFKAFIDNVIDYLRKTLEVKPAE